MDDGLVFDVDPAQPGYRPIRGLIATLGAIGTGVGLTFALDEAAKDGKPLLMTKVHDAIAGRSLLDTVAGSLQIRPHEVLTSVLNGSSPTDLVIEVIPDIVVKAQGVAAAANMEHYARADDIRPILHGVTAAAVVGAYDEFIPGLEGKWGKGWADRCSWPEVFRMLYLARNAFAHDDRFDWNRPSDAPATWRGLTVGDGNLGKPIWTVVGYADCLLLLLDAAVEFKSAVIQSSTNPAP